MAENKSSFSVSTLKIIIVIVIVIALWPVIEVLAGLVAAITTFAVGMGLAFIIFIAVVYPYNFTDKSDETVEPEFGNIEKNIQNLITNIHNKIKDFVGNKGD